MKSKIFFIGIILLFLSGTIIYSEELYKFFYNLSKDVRVPKIKIFYLTKSLELNPDFQPAKDELAKISPLKSLPELNKKKVKPVEKKMPDTNIKKYILSAKTSDFNQPGLKGIEVDKGKGYLKILILTTEELNYSFEKVTKPYPMFVVDILDAVNYLPLRKYLKVNNEKIKRIRHSLYRISPVRITRVVIDLKNESDLEVAAHNINKKNNIITVTLIKPAKKNDNTEKNGLKKLDNYIKKMNKNF